MDAANAARGPIASLMSRAIDIMFADTRLTLDAAGAIFMPDSGLLVISDLHLEKGSWLRAAQHPIPTLDTRDTLARIANLVTQYCPKQLVCLGDSFHDAGAIGRLQPADRAHLEDLVGKLHQWIWILGNHDPALPEDLPGDTAVELDIDGIRLRHEPALDGPEIVGHFHPKHRIGVARQRISGRCFVEGTALIIMPAFGTYTGGLPATDPAITRLVGPRARRYLMRNDRIWQVR